MPGAAGTVKLQNVQEIFGVSKKLCLSFAEHVGIKHVGVHDLTPLRHCPGTHYKFVMDLTPICRGRCFASSHMALSNISSHHSPQGSGRTLCAPTGGIPSQSPPHHSKPVFSLTITFQGHLACPIFTQKNGAVPHKVRGTAPFLFILFYKLYHHALCFLCLLTNTPSTIASTK